MSPNCDARQAGLIDHLVLHYTGMTSAEAAIARLCDAASNVSAHYVIDEDGAVHCLVDERMRAWHAGVSYWRGVRALNDRSIGIEIVNPGHEFGYRPFPPVQMQAVLEVCQGILARHAIPARNIVAHSDIAPDRKQDPGELFPWAWLAAQRVGLWSDALGVAGDVRDDLGAIGYDVTLPMPLVIAAFQRRFAPHRVDGVEDERTAARARAVAALLTGGC
ncbi:MAG TPA: N-acetylmuramoyl-L-alanine amidase [Acetobacteraceae bacterium]|nr:N-acetylmuramoyl-L-alanine amidase [Acetobacteraceae bacterium]HQU03013.1 N-acetylmuramoyl-L-alanine amidase [Acetobacteraceae bacterium]